MVTPADRIMVGHVVLVGDGAEGGADARGVDDVFDGEGDAFEHPRRLAGHDPTLGIPRLTQRLVSAERDEAIQFGLQSLRSRQHRVGDIERRDFLAGDALSQVRRGEEAQIVVHLLITCYGTHGEARRLLNPMRQVNR